MSTNPKKQEGGSSLWSRVSSTVSKLWMAVSTPGEESQKPVRPNHHRGSMPEFVVATFQELKSAIVETMRQPGASASFLKFLRHPKIGAGSEDLRDFEDLIAPEKIEDNVGLALAARCFWQVSCGTNIEYNFHQYDTRSANELAVKIPTTSRFLSRNVFASIRAISRSDVWTPMGVLSVFQRR